jgi:hypothetical protein
MVTCEQYSYASQATCSGAVTTNADGFYTFENVLFHDTDSVKLTVQATGYQSQEVTQTAFTMNEMQWDFSLNPAP